MNGNSQCKYRNKNHQSNSQNMFVFDECRQPMKRRPIGHRFLSISSNTIVDDQI